MQLQQPFNSAQFDPSPAFTVVPLDWYPVQIVESEPVETGGGTGGMLVLKLEILDGPYKGLKVNDNLNLWNSNADAVAIAQRHLSAICHVTGVYLVTKTEELHGKPFWAQIGPQKKDPQYNDVKQVKDLQGRVPGKSGAAAAPPAPPVPAAAAPAGWNAPAPQAVAQPPAVQQAPQGWQPGPPAPAVQPAAAAPPQWGAPPAQAAVAPAPQQAPAPQWNPNAAPPAAPPWAK